MLKVFSGMFNEYLKPFRRHRESCFIIQLLLYEVNGNFVFGFRENTIHVCCGDEMITFFLMLAFKLLKTCSVIKICCFLLVVK